MKIETVGIHSLIEYGLKPDRDHDFLAMKANSFEQYFQIWKAENFSSTRFVKETLSCLLQRMNKRHLLGSWRFTEQLVKRISLHPL